MYLPGNFITGEKRGRINVSSNFKHAVITFELVISKLRFTLKQIETINLS